MKNIEFNYVQASTILIKELGSVEGVTVIGCPFGPGVIPVISGGFSGHGDSDQSQKSIISLLTTVTMR
jgi:hypothetical protein